MRIRLRWWSSHNSWDLEFWFCLSRTTYVQFYPSQSTKVEGFCLIGTHSNIETHSGPHSCSGRNWVWSLQRAEFCFVGYLSTVESHSTDCDLFSHLSSLHVCDHRHLIIIIQLLYNHCPSYKLCSKFWTLQTSQMGFGKWSAEECSPRNTQTKNGDDEPDISAYIDEFQYKQT